MTATIETCTGHIGFFSGEFSGGTWEYFRKADGSLWRAYACKATDYQTGYRLGASFVAPAHMAEQAIAQLPELFGVTVEEEEVEEQQPAPRGWECVEGGEEEASAESQDGASIVKAFVAHVDAGLVALREYTAAREEYEGLQDDMTWGDWKTREEAIGKMRAARARYSAAVIVAREHRVLDIGRGMFR